MLLGILASPGGIRCAATGAMGLLLLRLLLRLLLFALTS
jgi:hypothetical protein